MIDREILREYIIEEYLKACEKMANKTIERLNKLDLEVTEYERRNKGSFDIKAKKQ